MKTSRFSRCCLGWRPSGLCSPPGPMPLPVQLQLARRGRSCGQASVQGRHGGARLPAGRGAAGKRSSRPFREHCALSGLVAILATGRAPRRQSQGAALGPGALGPFSLGPREPGSGTADSGNPCALRAGRILRGHLGRALSPGRGRSRLSWSRCGVRPQLRARVPSGAWGS